MRTLLLILLLIWGLAAHGASPIVRNIITTNPNPTTVIQSLSPGVNPNTAQLGTNNAALRLDVVTDALLTNTVFYSGPSGSGTLAVDMETRILHDGTVTALDWSARKAYDAGLDTSVDWGAWKLHNNSGTEVLNWNTRTWASGWTFLSFSNHADVSAAAFVTGGAVKWDGVTGTFTNGLSLYTNAVAFGFDGSGGTIPASTVAYTSVDKTGTIYEWEIIANGSSPTCTIDVWKIAAGTAIPTVANTIMGTKPALATGNVLRSSTTTGWSTLTVTRGDIIAANIDAATVATKISFKLVYRVTQ